MRHVESSIQKTCVTWFRLQYRPFANLFFAVPNGGARNAREASIMKGEGVTAGVADAILLYPAGPYNCLCVEFKTEVGRQQPSQKEWQALVEAHGGKYIVCRSLEQFREEVRAYFAQGAYKPLQSPNKPPMLVTSP